MADTPTTIHDMPVLVCAPDGKKLMSEQDALDLIGEAFYHGTRIVVVPVERLANDFFQLKTRLAGQIIQKFVNYQQRLVVLGDISQYLDQSSSFKAFVYEANRGNDLWFLANLQELEGRLKRIQ
ncbi:DUF4180 domain-containing protein [Dictyobacter kobayashii]|uniref:DUF4180 domain-containing protein n=1 Tax=Dictyobacter kobayashii TaxID=2014872 RepID=A0A402APN9_9CHLR|nr:DUF4180 domain-containing protein [Dictyobacter kobayashii]GCE21024.1 hypothetical protein KDK_48240 [Dictyobacter kobayashii]